MVKTVKLSEVATVSLGQTFRVKAEAEDSTSGIRLVQIRDIREGYLTDVTQLGFAQIGLDKLTFQVQQNDLLLPVRGSRFESAVFKADTGPHPATTTNQVAIVRDLSPELRLDYLLWYLNSTGGRAALSAITHGSTVQSISLASLSSLEIPFPSKVVQEKVSGIYSNWQHQKLVLNALLENGKNLTEQFCSELAVSQSHIDE